MDNKPYLQLKQRSYLVSKVAELVEHLTALPVAEGSTPDDSLLNEKEA